MRNSMLKLASMSVAISAIAMSAPAFAQEASEEAAGPVSVTGGIALASDYRFRGVSLSGKDFAVQPYLTVKHESGLYVGAWGSNLSENDGDDVEVDVYAGFAGGEAVTYDIGATYYLYPGVSSLNYVEFTGKLGSTLGPATVGVQLSYVPSQDNTGNDDNIYFGTNASIALPNSPISIVGLLSLRAARRVMAGQGSGEDLFRLLRRHRVTVQVIGMVSIFVTSMWGMYQNMQIGALGN